MPTPSRFTSPTLAPGPKSIGTQRRPRSRGGVGVGRYWGRSPGGPSDDLPLGRRRLGWVSYYRVLPPPAATARLSERVRVCGGGASGSGGSVRATCGTFEPRTFSGDSHTPPRGGGIRLLCSFCYWCLGRCCCRWSRACCRCCCSARASCSTCLIAAVKAGERWYRPFFSIEINLLYFARSSSAQPVLSLRISTACPRTNISTTHYKKSKHKTRRRRLWPCS